jgi:hypothetical protein
MWPTFEEYKKKLEDWLESHHPNYLNDIGNVPWINAFTGNHHSMVIIVHYLIFNYIIFINFVFILAFT